MAATLGRDDDRHATGLGEFQRVGHEVRKALVDAQRIEHHLRGSAFSDVAMQSQALVTGNGGIGMDDALGHLLQRAGDRHQFDLARFDA